MKLFYLPETEGVEHKLMNRQSLRSLVVPALLTLAPLFAFFVLKRQPAWDPVFHLHVEHFYIVSVVALLSAAVAVTVGIAGSRLRNLQVIFLSLAFTSLALLFALHGLSTPGFLLPPTRLPAVAAQLSTLLTAFWLWLSVVPSDHPVIARLSERPHRVVPIWSTLLAVFVLATLMFPPLVAALPLDQAPLKWGVAGLTVTLALLAASRYWTSYRYSRFPLQISIFYSATWLAAAQLMMSWGEVWRASWWIYHFLLLAGMVLMVVGLVRQYGLHSSLSLVVAGFFGADPSTRIEAAISPSVRALVVATEARDPYTAGHAHRVALAALRLGEAMGLPPEQLRALVQGGVVHDVGKIAVPDVILNKAAALQPEERKAIERHPVVGFDMCKRLGFMKEELAVIRFHHERWDGTGYPDQLQGEAIPLLARILAIADVYDALTSKRSYRDAWNHHAAREYIIAQAGTQFDPVCVESWARLTASEATSESSSLHASTRVAFARAPSRGRGEVLTR